MSAKSSSLVTLGVIVGAHGVRGDVRVRSFTEYPEDVFAYGPLLSETGEVLIDPIKARPAKTHFIVTPETARSKEAWDALKGAKLCVPRDALPPPDEDEFYIDDLVGLSVVDEAGEVQGRIKAVLNHGAGDLLEISLKGAPKPVLVPLTQEDVPEINFEAGKVTVLTLDLWSNEAPDKDEDEDEREAD